MFFKKMGMAILTTGFVSLIALSPVSVSAQEEQTFVVAASETETENNVEVENPQIPADSKDQATPVNTLPPVSETEQVVNTAPSVMATPMATPKMYKVTKKVNSKSKKKVKAKKAKKTASYTKSELRLMASIINCEAGGESFQGQVAVGIVVMNRVKSKAFPNTIKKVIYQRGQFSPVRNGSLRQKLRQYDAGKIHSAQWKSCIKAAKKALNGQTTIKLKGKTKSMKGVRFFSVYMSGAKFRLGGHRFR